MPAALQELVVTISDLGAFLASPGGSHHTDRMSENYVRSREEELLLFCKHLFTQFSKPLRAEDLVRVRGEQRTEWIGATPLHIAAEYRSPSVLRQMLESTPEVHSALRQQDLNGLTVLDWAKRRPKGNSRTAILGILQGYGIECGTEAPTTKKAPRSIVPVDFKPHAIREKAQNKKSSAPGGQRQLALGNRAKRRQENNPEGAAGIAGSTSRSNKAAAAAPRLVTHSKTGTQVQAIDLIPVHRCAREDAVQTEACLKQIKSTLHEHAVIEQKFKILQRGIQKSLRLPEHIHVDLQRKTAEYRKRFFHALDPSPQEHTLEALEAQLGALRTRNNALRVEMEALRQEYVQARTKASPVTAFVDQSTPNQPQQEMSLASASEDRLHAENVALVTSESRLKKSTSHNISTEHLTITPTDMGAANRIAQLIEEYQSALDTRAGCRADYRAMQAQIEFDTGLGETERDSLLTSIKRRTTALQDSDDRPSVEPLTADELEKRLASLKGDNSLLIEGFEKLCVQREKLAATPRDLQLSPRQKNPGCSAGPVQQPALLMSEVDDLRLLSARIASDSKIPEDARKKLTDEARRALSNSFLQADPQRISQHGNPAKQKWAAMAQTHAHAELNKISSRIYDQYERARSGDDVDLDWGKTRRQQLVTLINSETRHHIAKLRTELQPIAKANRLCNEMSALHGLASETLHQSIKSAPQNLPKIKSALSKLASALNQRLVRHLPWADIQKMINATINWSALQNTPTRDDMEELSLLKRQLAYQTQLNEVSRLLSEPQNEGVIHEHRDMVARCATYLNEVVESLEKLSSAQDELSGLAQRSTVAARAAELQLTASGLQVARLDPIISRKLEAMADLRPTDTFEPAMEALRDTCRKVSAELKREANSIETLYGTLCAYT